jgi:hypothetical protein
MMNTTDLILSLSLSMALQPFRPWPLFPILSYTQSVGLLGRRISPSQAATFTNRTTQAYNKRTQTYMPRVGFESTIPVFERAKTVHVLDRAATVTGTQIYLVIRNRSLTLNSTSGSMIDPQVTAYVAKKLTNVKVFPGLIS